MKKITYLLLALSALATTSYSQGFYFRAGVGYSLPSAGQSIDGTGTPYNGSRTITTVDSVDFASYSIKKASLASGAHGVIAAGYMFNEHVGIDAEADLGLSSTVYSFTDNNVPVRTVLYNITVTQKATFPIIFIPSLLLQSNGESINIYTRFGAVLPLKTKVTQHQIFENLPGKGRVQREDYTWDIKNSFSLGFSAAAGCQFKLGNRSKLWAEASFLSLSVYTKEANMTEVAVDGEPGYLSQVPVGLRKVVFSNNFKARTDDYYHQPIYSQPFSNLALKAGIIFELNTNSSGSTARKNLKDRRKKF